MQINCCLNKGSFHSLPSDPSAMPEAQHRCVGTSDRLSPIFQRMSSSLGSTKCLMKTVKLCVEVNRAVVRPTTQFPKDLVEKAM